MGFFFLERFSSLAMRKASDDEGKWRIGLALLTLNWDSSPPASGVRLGGLHESSSDVGSGTAIS